MAWRESFNRGEYLGPRLFSCGYGLRTRAGHDPSGSDQGPPRDAPLLEIECLAQCGLGSHGAIVAATRNAAELCRVADRVGTVEPGKLADLIVVAGNPLEDIHHLRRLLLVITDGRVMVDKRLAS